ncbi:MAG: nucleotidyltransferase domain-containing protein [Planctomycetota bacterium]
MFKWPDREAVLAAARHWATQLRQADPAVQRVACIGSYARGDWGVGSDLDLIVLLSESALNRPQRYARYCPEGLPVPADLWVYTQTEWDSLQSQSSLLAWRIQQEMLDL